MRLSWVRHAWAGIAAIVLAGHANCTCTTSRSECARDGDCGDEAVCLYDDRCAPRDVAARAGAELGDECVVSGGHEIGCEADEICRMGWCTGAEADAATDAARGAIDSGGSDGAGPDAGGTDGAAAACTAGVPGNLAPLFGGLSNAAPDGPDAVVLQWIAAADETLPDAISYLVFVSQVPGAFDFTAPDATVVGDTTYRLSGLTPGTPYYFVVRARDAEGQIECNVKELSATPDVVSGCIDYAADIQSIFDARCITCHSGPTAPQGLHLDSYAGVIAGGATGNEIVACQPASSLLYLKISMDTPPVGARMPFGGPYLTTTQIDTIGLWIEQGASPACPEDPALCSDATPPSFAGITSATLTDDTTAELCWTAATDDVTAPSAIVYDVYEATVPGGQDFGAPPRTTTPAGDTCASAGGLTPGQQYCWVVRARDAAGNRDANTAELCVTTPTASCIDYATIVQPIFDGECIHCHSGPLAPQGLHLDSYAGVIAGGATGNEVVACQSGSSLLYQKISMSTPPVGVRMPADGPPYLTAAQIAAIQQWIDEGARSSCAAPDICSDTTPPSFGGITSATAIDAATAELCWAAATDDVTAPASIVYDAYQASTPGGQDFAALPRTTSGPGALCVLVPALSPEQQYCWVVRARDAAGNRDANTAELCVTMPALPPGCVEYDDMIQPLFDANCTRCHNGARPPQWLRLASYDQVIAGSVRRNEVVACSPGASLLVDKISPGPSIGARMPRDGPPYLTSQQIAMLSQWIADGARRSCAEPSTCGDTAAPAFGGATSATALDETTIEVCWSAATDDATPAASIRYDVYEAASLGGEVYGQPAQSTVTGVTCATVRAGPSTTMCFVVRARDLAGNADSNTVERCATTPAATCAVDYDDLIQPILSARCTHCHQPGAAPPRFLDLSSYAGALAGGSLRDEVDACDWAGSLINTKTAGNVCGQRMPFDGPPWLAPSERSLLRRWVESGARRACSEPAVCSDATPPAFGGAASAVDLDATTIEVCWAAAADATTSADAIVYEVYEAAAPGAESFASPASYAVSGGATCIAVPAPPARTTCYVVRARDLAGNRDGNAVERCATTAGACFAYDDLIQPIFDARCVHCHSGPSAPRDIRWDSYANAIADPGEVEACNADGSKLNRAVEDCKMPRDTMSDLCSTTACLTPSQQWLLRTWVDGGAHETCPWGGCP